jgi:hypothetical protein
LKKIEINLDFARSSKSKYQISLVEVITCKIKESITFNLLSFDSVILNELKENIKKMNLDNLIFKHKKDYKVIEDSVLANIEVMKK